MDIRQYLSQNGLTQSALAEKANISRQLLNYHIKNPSTGWHIRNAEKIVKAIYGEVIREKVIELVTGGY